ncbi:MAG: hypothetical protein HY811_08230 [Planctomycetes bacterium]|nr:hypothetical protein [Planctomycetota bacterium]
MITQKQYSAYRLPRVFRFVLLSAMALALACLPAWAEDDGISAREKSDFLSKTEKRLSNLQNDQGAFNDLCTTFGVNSPIPTTFGLTIKCAELLGKIKQGKYEDAALDGLKTLGEYGLEQAAKVFTLAKAVNMAYAAGKLGKYLGDSMVTNEKNKAVEATYESYRSTNRWAGEDVTRDMYLDRWWKWGMVEYGAKKFPDWALEYFNKRMETEQAVDNAINADLEEGKKTVRKKIFKEALPKMFPGMSSESAGKIAELITEGKVSESALEDILTDAELKKMMAAGPVKGLKKPSGGAEGKQKGTLEEVLAYLESQKAQLIAGVILYGTYEQNVKQIGITDSENTNEDEAKLSSALKSAEDSILSSLNNSGFKDLLESLRSKSSSAYRKIGELKKEIGQSVDNKVSQGNLTYDINWDNLRMDMLANPEETKSKWDGVFKKDRELVEKDIFKFKKHETDLNNFGEVKEGLALSAKLEETVGQIPGIVSVYYRAQKPVTVMDLNNLITPDLMGKPADSPEGEIKGELAVANLRYNLLTLSVRESLAGLDELLRQPKGNLEALYDCHDRAVKAIPKRQLISELAKAGEDVMDKMRRDFDMSVAFYEDGKVSWEGGVIYKGKVVNFDSPGVYDIGNMAAWEKTGSYNASWDENITKKVEDKISRIKGQLSFIESLPTAKSYVDTYRAEAVKIQAELDKLEKETTELGYGLGYTTDAGNFIERCDLYVAPLQKKMDVVLKRGKELKTDVAGWGEYLVKWKDLMSRLKAGGKTTADVPEAVNPPDGETTNVPEEKPETPGLRNVMIQGRRWDDIENKIVVHKDELKDGQIEISGQAGSGFVVGKTKIEIDTGDGWKEVSYEGKSWAYKFKPKTGEMKISVRAVNPDGAVSDSIDFPRITVFYDETTGREKIEKVIARLKDAFEKKDLKGFMDNVSSDFYFGDDTLRDQLRRFFDAANTVRLNIVIDSYDTQGAKRMVSAHWDRTFVATGSAAQTKQSGKTTLVFSADDNKLLALKGDVIFVIPSDTASPLGGNANVTTGRITMQNEFTSNEGYSFHSGGMISVLDDPDFYWNTSGIISSINGGLIDLGSKELDEVATVPEAGYQSATYMPAVEGHSYALKTIKGKYAVLYIETVNGTDSIKVNWKYNSEGGRDF